MQTRSSTMRPIEQDPEIERILHRKVRQLAQEFENTKSVVMAFQEGQPKTLANYTRPTFDGTQLSIVRPLVIANIFDLKLVFIQIVQQSCSFHGLPNKDPNAHLSTFLEVCDMLKLNGVFNDAIKLKVFPLSLKLRTKE